MNSDHMTIVRCRAARACANLKNSNPVPFDDCLGEAFVIFCEALQKYDPSRGAKFETVLTAYLKHLERKILLANRWSVEGAGKNIYPEELNPELTAGPQSLPVVELSTDGQLLVSLLLGRAIGSDYGTGKGKKNPGKRSILPFMKLHYGWSHKKTEFVMDEITDWWRDQF